jgi:GNAT superfamily N-acetyltransferase
VSTTPAPIEIESARSRPALGDVAYVVARVSPASRLGPEQLAHYLSANPGSVMLLARSGTEAVGAATVARSGRPGHQYTMVRVVPEHRRRGAGSAMAQIARARQAGIERLVTSNDAPNAAMLAVNQRLGYRVVSEGVLVEGPAQRT